MQKEDRLVLELHLAHDYCASKNPRLTVIFIHGIASSSLAFEKTLLHLENTEALKDVRFITFDLLGSGKSLKDDALNYDYDEQLRALHRSISKLKINTPLIMVGHSMGTLISARYVSTYPHSVSQLVLVSPPVYTIEDLKSPAYRAGMKLFRDAVSVKNRKVLEEKAFNNSMSRIVSDKDNYKTLESIKMPTVLIYGKKDQLIGAHNIPKLLKTNSSFISAIQTEGGHGMTSDKFGILAKILEEKLKDFSKESGETK